MGMNFISCCHKCMEQCYHFRGKENETMTPFYKAHYSCMREDPSNLETYEDQLQEKPWMRGPLMYKEWR